MKLVGIIPVMQKARNARLVPKRVQVTRDGTTYMTTVWTAPGGDTGTFDLFDQPEKPVVPVVRINQRAAKHSESARIGESKAEKKTDASLKRSRHDVIFEKPYTGKTGAKLLGYTWPHISVEEEDGRGEIVIRHYSDWEQSDVSEMTGRKFVHKFIIERTDGTMTTLSAESAAVALGISEAATRAKARKLLENEIENAKAKEKAKADFEKYDAGPWFKTPAEAVENIDSGFRHVWIQHREWGAKDRAFKEEYGHAADYSNGRHDIPMTYVPGRGYKALDFYVRNKYASDMAARAGYRMVKIEAKDIWDANGNPYDEPRYKQEMKDWYHKIEGEGSDA